MGRIKVPQYMHMPLQILWFDTGEIMVIMVLYVFGLIFGGWAWLSVIIGPYLYIQVKRRKPRGFLRHLLYQLGFYRLDGYPSPHTNEFYE